MTAGEDEVRFGSFCLQPGRRLLLLEGAPVALGARAMDILLALVERAGEFVGNDELVRRVWPTTVVVEGNLRVHMAALRKVLGDARDGQRLIVNVPNRGYSFIGTLSRSVGPVGPVQTAVAPMPARAGMPTPLHRVIGRDVAIDALCGHLHKHRLVTLVGAGGIGKTTVALSVAAHGASDGTDERWSSVHFVDLAPLAAPALVPSALASALGLPSVADDVMANLLAFLHDKAVLVVLDNCEHVLSAVADVVEAVLRGAPRVKILATSREPLRASGEWIQRLQALDLPPATLPPSAKDALAFGAIELLVERVSAAIDTFTFADADVPAAVEICRRLDGMPLAIELAAARVDPLGLRGVASALDDCFALLNKGRRTAVPRHQTLQATLDWSFGLLSPRDQRLLLRLSAFAGSFTLESAGAVSAWGELSRADVLDAVSDLSAKSLIATDVSGDDVLFRLLDTTRVYASALLAQGDDAQPTSRHHAEHCVAFLAAAEREWASASTQAWRRSYGRRIDDVRKALRWAFSPAGDVALGMAITARSALLFFQLSLADELRDNAVRAIDAMARQPEPDPQLEFELQIVFGHALFHTRGLQPESERAFERALELAEASGCATRRALSYSTAWMGAYNRGEPQLMLAFARKFETAMAGEDDSAMALLLDRMMAPALHFLGDQHGARQAAERALADPARLRPPFLSGSQIDRRVSAGAILGRVLWVQGFPLQAEAVLQRTVEIAAHDGESIALAFALGFSAIPVAMWSGSFGLARQRLELMLRHTAEHSLLGWRHLALASERLLCWSENPLAAGDFPDALLRSADANPHFADLLSTLHPGYPGPAARRRSEAGKSAWLRAEMLRLDAERARATDAGVAESLFIEAIALARADGALAWELRATLGLARLWHERGRHEEALDRLESVLGRVTEGFGTLDVRQAVALYLAVGASVRPRSLKAFPSAD